MLIVSPGEFDAYTLNYDDSTLKELYCETAQSVVEGFLGYKLIADDYQETVQGELISLGAMPVNSVASLTINGNSITPEQYEIKRNRIIVTDGSINLSKRTTAVISYNAGWPIAEKTEEGETIEYVAIPSEFKAAVLKVASLLMLEQGGNIGVTGLSIDNGVNRQFVNYSNYQKHLQILSKWRVRRYV